MSSSLPAAADPAAPEANRGCIDFMAYAPSLDGWIGGGWIELGWDDQDEAPDCALDFGDATLRGSALLCLFPRADVRKIGTGLLFFVAAPAARREHFQALVLHRGDAVFPLTPSDPADRITEADAIGRVRQLVATSSRSARRAHLLRLVNRPAFTGTDTLDALQPPVFLELDSASLCPPDGLLLRGWLIDPFSSIESIRVRCGAESRVLDSANWISIPRPDVREGFARSFGGLHDECGFLSFVGGAYVLGEQPYFEIRTRSGEVAFKKLPAIRSPGIDTIKETLGHLELRYAALERGYDHVLGPAIAAMNRFRLRDGVSHTDMVFGPQPERPRCSIIVPLYGRIDFMELQLAFFSRTLARDHELIYVLDDPSILRATEALATSALARFGLPFRLLALARNMGYAPANNVGLREARGDYVCFLNSDVFPKEPDWLEHMLETMDRHPNVGVCGPLLVFEDETVQHDGVAYEPLPEFANWQFSLHPRKGRAPVADGVRVREVEAVTG
ncbi:MAG: glycosyltransferase, partial [Gluconacetobacter diazotrophicus]|nr:glycosyltransferase [Gluconacetobacter diazotrophicus]